MWGKQLICDESFFNLLFALEKKIKPGTRVDRHSNKGLLYQHLGAPRKDFTAKHISETPNHIGAAMEMALD